MNMDIRYHDLLDKAYQKAKAQGIPCTMESMYHTLVNIGLMQSNGLPTENAKQNGFSKNCTTVPNAFRTLSDEYAERHHLLSLKFIDPKLYFGNGLTDKRAQLRYQVDSMVQRTREPYLHLMKRDVRTMLSTNVNHRKAVKENPKSYGANEIAEKLGVTVDDVITKVCSNTSNIDTEARAFMTELDSNYPIDYSLHARELAVIWSKIMCIQLDNYSQTTAYQKMMVHAHFKYSCRQLLGRLSEQIGMVIISKDVLKAKALVGTYPLTLGNHED